MKHIRQGDLIFTRTNKEVKGQEKKQLLIAEGEFTGHNHMLIAEGESKIMGDKTLFHLTGKAKLTHPEHDTLIFEPGTYIVRFEREFDYVENQLQQVRD